LSNSSKTTKRRLSVTFNSYANRIIVAIHLILLIIFFNINSSVRSVSWFHEEVRHISVNLRFGFSTLLSLAISNVSHISVYLRDGTSLIRSLMISNSTCFIMPSAEGLTMSVSTSPTSRSSFPKLSKASALSRFDGREISWGKDEEFVSPIRRLKSGRRAGQQDTMIAVEHSRAVQTATCAVVADTANAIIRVIDMRMASPPRLNMNTRRHNSRFGTWSCRIRKKGSVKTASLATHRPNGDILRRSTIIFEITDGKKTAYSPQLIH